MKKPLFLLAFALNVTLVSAQVTPMEQEVEKVRRSGYVATTTVDSKLVNKVWKQKLAEFGRVEEGRSDVYKVGYAKLPFSYSSNANIVSQLNTKRGKTDVFLSVDLGANEYVSSTHANSADIQKILTDFLRQVDYEAQVQAADKAVADVTEKQQDMLKKGDKLTRNLNNNKVEKEKLLKKISENEAELKQLELDIAQNKKDQEASLQAVEGAKKAATAVRERKDN